MAGKNTYNKSQMEELANGFNRADPNLLSAVNTQWKKLRDYAALGGTPESDEWGQDCNQPPRGELWMEKNCTVQKYGNMSIWEPCNYASNMAYYHTFLETCSENHNWSFPIKSKNAICKTYALLGFASSFFHATQTDNGGAVDVRVVDMIFFVAYQETVTFLKTSKQSIVKELSVEKRSQPAVEIIDDMMNMFVDRPISKWGSILTNYDYPNINIGIAALVGLIISLIMPLHPKEGELIMNSTLSIMNLFEHRINSTDFIFYEEEFIPAMIDSTADMRKVLPTREVKTLFKNSVGVMIKFVFAILYQEQTIQNEKFNKYWKEDFVSNFGYNFLPLINNLASSLTSFGDSYSRKDFQNGIKFYPGEEVCNERWHDKGSVFLHPRWHLQTAIAFPDLAFLADDTHRIIKLYGTKKYPILANNGEELWIQSYRRSSHIKHSSGMKNVKNISKGSKTENIKSIVPFVEYFRGIGWLMTGNQEYNKTFLEDLEFTLYQLGNPSTKDLTKSIVAQWEKIKQYAASGGNPPTDAWKRCNDTSNKPEQTEKNCTFLEHGKIPIWEPCNYASSIPFFHSTIEMSKNGRLWSMPKESKHAIGKALASLGLVSSFYHASQTKNAEDCDNRVIDLIMFVLYQSAVDNLWTNSTKSIIRDLNEVERNETANNMVDFAMNMYVETPIAEWGATLNEYNFPSVYRSGIALFLLAFRLVLPPYLYNNVIIGFGLPIALEQAKNIIKKEDRDFLSTWDNNAKHIIENITLPEEEAKKLFKNLVGVIIKLLYALLWNENAISEIIPINALINEIGYEIMPLINDLVNTMTSFQLSDTDFQEGKNLYPGEELCNKGGNTGDNPHPKWHVQTAILLPDVVYLSDEIHRIITTYGKF